MRVHAPTHIAISVVTAIVVTLLEKVHEDAKKKARNAGTWTGSIRRSNKIDGEGGRRNGYGMRKEKQLVRKEETVI